MILTTLNILTMTLTIWTDQISNQKIKKKNEVITLHYMSLHLISVSVERYFLALKVLKIIPILYKPYVDDLNMALKVKKVEEGE